MQCTVIVHVGIYGERTRVVQVQVREIYGFCMFFLFLMSLFLKFQLY